MQEFRRKAAARAGVATDAALTKWDPADAGRAQAGRNGAPPAPGAARHAGRCGPADSGARARSSSRSSGSLAESNCGCSSHRWRREAILLPPFFFVAHSFPRTKKQTAGKYPCRLLVIPSGLLSLFRQRRRAGDRESRLRFGLSLFRLRAADAQRVLAGENGAVAPGRPRSRATRGSILSVTSLLAPGAMVTRSKATSE